MDESSKAGKPRECERPTESVKVPKLMSQEARKCVQSDSKDSGSTLKVRIHLTHITTKVYVKLP